MDVMKQMDALRGPLIIVGVAMIGVGSVLLLYLGMLVYQVLNAPEKVAIIKYVLAHVKVNDLAAYGSMLDTATRQNVRFEINLTDTIRTILFIFLGVGIMSALAAILGILIRSGVRIVELAMREGRMPRKPAPVATPANRMKAS